jgi:ATP-dependent Lon protease
VVVNADNLNDFLGVRKYTYGRAEKQNQVGQVVGSGLDRGGRRPADHRSGLHARQGRHHRTGSLGDVMKESVEAARTVVRSRAARLGIKDECSRSATSTSTCPTAPRPRTAQRGRGHDHGLCVGADRHSGAADVAMTGEITCVARSRRSAA